MQIKPSPIAVLLLAVLVLAGCAASPIKPYAGNAPNSITLYLTVDGQHSKLALPAWRIHGRLAFFRRDFPDARYLSFGWGERTYFMARHPTFGETLRAIFPAPSAIQVAALSVAPPKAFTSNTKVFPVKVSRPGFLRLSRYIWSYVATDKQGRPRRLGPGHRPHSAFYASNGTYDLFHTCNTWTDEALKVAGKPVQPSGVILARQVVEQAQGFEGSPRSAGHASLQPPP